MLLWENANHQCYIHGGSSLAIIEDKAKFDYLRSTMSTRDMWVYTAARRDELVIFLKYNYNIFFTKHMSSIKSFGSATRFFQGRYHIDMNVLFIVEYFKPIPNHIAQILQLLIFYERLQSEVVHV